MLYCVQQVSHIQFSIHAPSPQSCQDTHCHPRHTPEAKDRHPAPRITCTWLRPHGENGSCLLNPIKFAGVVVFVVFCVCMPSRTQLPQRVPSPACHLQATPRRIPFLAPAACSSLLDLCYSFATAPPCTCHQPSLTARSAPFAPFPQAYAQGSPAVQHFLPYVLLSAPWPAVTSNSSSSFPYRFPFPLLCRHCISSSASSLLPMVSSARIRRTAICASFLCTSHIPLHLGNSRTTAVLYDGLASTPCNTRTALSERNLGNAFPCHRLPDRPHKLHSCLHTCYMSCLSRPLP